MQLDPRIGYLNSGVFYAFANGYDQPEVRGTREEVEVALGLRRPQPAAQAPAKRARRIPCAHTYEVTVTERWPGGERQESYTVDVSAINAREAIKKERQRRFDEEGSMRLPATYRARRKD